MRVFKIIVVVLLLFFVVIQFIPTERNQNDTIPITDLTNLYDVPKQVGIIFKTSCYDCHSNNTSYPWYDKIQPTSWFLEDHIKEGKAELNFNEFGNYSTRKQKSKLRAMTSQIEDGEMPLPSYTWIHWDAKLSENEKTVVLGWIEKLNDSLER